MAKGLVTVTSSGLKEFITEMEDFVRVYPEVVKKSVEARLDVVKRMTQVNWVSSGGTSGGYVYSSIGYNVAESKNSKYDVISSVGVYKIDTLDSRFGKTEKDLNAAQIAYWVEFGTSRLRGGGRKSKKGDYSDEDLIKVNGTSFLSSAMYSSMKAQEEEFKREFNRLMNELKR